MLRVLFGVLRLGWRGAFFAAIALAISLQVATLTLAGVNAAVGGAIAAVTGAKTVSQVLRTEVAAKTAALGRSRTALRDTRRRIGRRVTRSVAAAPSKALPAAGAAVVLTMTVSELAAACETFAAIDQELDGGEDGAPEEPDAMEEDLRRFCRQNAGRLAAASAEIEPLLEPFDDAGGHIWATASDMIDKTEAAVEEASRWQEQVAAVPARVCAWVPDWIC